jgi:hypothetical protein
MKSDKARRSDSNLATLDSKVPAFCFKSLSGISKALRSSLLWKSNSPTSEIDRSRPVAKTISRFSRASSPARTCSSSLLKNSGFG